MGLVLDALPRSLFVRIVHYQRKHLMDARTGRLKSVRVSERTVGLSVLFYGGSVGRNGSRMDILNRACFL